LKVADLKKYYGENFNNAYDEIRQELGNLGFTWTQESVYMNSDTNNSLSAVYSAISKLSSISWFKQSVRDIRAFKVEDWSDFTDIVKR
jgi:virulence-associated protein VapD